MEAQYFYAIAMFEMALGPNVPALAQVFEAYADLLRVTGRPAEAEPLEDRAREIPRRGGRR